MSKHMTKVMSSNEICTTTLDLLNINSNLFFSKSLYKGDALLFDTKTKVSLLF